MVDLLHGIKTNSKVGSRITYLLDLVSEKRQPDAAYIIETLPYIDHSIFHELRGLVNPQDKLLFEKLLELLSPLKASQIKH